MSAVEDRVAQVRAFNRFYTNVIGVLAEGLLRTQYSLTEARVIFELAQREATEVGHLREVLDVDGGYLSRILSRFDADGLVQKQRSAVDGRRQMIRLTARGRRAFRMLDKRATTEVRGLLSAVGEQEQRRLLAAMTTIRDILEESPRADHYLLRPPEVGDFGWVVHRHGVIYAQEYAWDESFEALVARIVADYVEEPDRRRQRAWIAEADGRPVGCVFCVQKEDTTAQLRLLLVEPRYRGMGIGARLVDECVRFAARTGFKEIVLWTNDVLEDARRLYERANFALVEEEPHHSFGHDLVGQIWRRALP
jgi:DNA-binding MarR family transcriptional regulator/GNAT superfamily N-acetyltransferase